MSIVLFQRRNCYCFCGFTERQKQILHFYLIMLAKLATKSHASFRLFSGVLKLQKAVGPLVVYSLICTQIHENVIFFTKSTQKKKNKPKQQKTPTKS